MHAGRQYPYHPTYWATEGWFWPGFVPWKMHLEVFGSSNSPWNFYPAGYNENSQPGRIENGGKDVVYDYIGLSPLGGLILRLNTTYNLGLKVCQWSCTLVSGAVTFGRAVNFQPIPQRRILNNSWPIIYGGYPYPNVGPPAYQFTPTRYSEGGSPWPHY